MKDRLKQYFGGAWEDIASNGGVDLPLDRRSVAVLILTSVLLTFFYYYGRPVYFRSSLERDVVELLGMEKSTYRGLLSYTYWAVTSVTFRIALPMLIIWFWFKESVRDYGFRLWEKGHGKYYLGMFLFMLPLLVGVSFMESFQDKYPFYDDAGKSVIHFGTYQVMYGIQFFALEAFFRGFLVFALFKRFGYYAVIIMTIPYCMIHFGKPIAETLGAVIAGVILGYAALKSKSWLPGALLHWSVGFTMDVLCTIHDKIR